MTRKIGFAFDKEKAEWVAINCDEYGFLKKDKNGRFGIHSRKPEENPSFNNDNEYRVLQYLPSVQEAGDLIYLHLLILMYGGNPRWLGPFIL